MRRKCVYSGWGQVDKLVWRHKATGRRMITVLWRRQNFVAGIWAGHAIRGVYCSDHVLEGQWVKGKKQRCPYTLTKTYKESGGVPPLILNLTQTNSRTGRFTSGEITFGGFQIQTGWRSMNVHPPCQALSHACTVIRSSVSLRTHQIEKSWSYVHKSWLCNILRKFVFV